MLCIFMHCYGHALNLGVGDTIKFSLQLDVEMMKNNQMHTFDFLFGIFLGNLLLRHTDNFQQDPSAQISFSCRRPEASQADFGYLAVSS